MSALDVSVQGQILNLMVRFQKELNLSYIFISHDLSVVEYISDRVAIMYLGRVVEQGTKSAIFDNPGHPYTRALMDAVPVAHPAQRREREPISGESPSAVNPPPRMRLPPALPVRRRSLPRASARAGADGE